MNKRLIAPVLAFAAVSLSLSATGCAKHAQLVVVAAAPAPLPPPPALPAAPEPPPQIALPGELEFDVNEATIKNTPQSAAVLAKLAEIMNDNPRITKLRIEGHTDNWGRAKRNLRLSQDRADAVAFWLVAHDIDSSRLVTVGFGQTRPLVNNDSNEHRKMNRRTEFHVQELDGEPTDDVSTPALSPVAER
jgi:OOP family OmpA-OmpF porin